jgi:hypothetical protein
VFNERTGNPVKDNRARHANKKLSDIRRCITVKGAPRKRKKTLSHEAFIQYVEVVLTVMSSMQKAASKNRQRG